MKAADLYKLQAFFDPEDLEWKPITTSKRTGKSLVAAYVTNRAIQDRLDEVCGPADWRNEFMAGPAGGVLCGIAIYVERADGSAEWVTKWDGAENTDVEAIKGGLSGSMKRAASQWGIGRYLYRMPPQWVAVDERGRFRQPPQLPPAFRPAPSRPAASAPARNGHGAEAPYPPPRRLASH